MSDTESLSEREFTDFLDEAVFSGKPRSVGEALAAADEPDPEPPVEAEPAAVTPPPPPVEEPPIVVTDDPQQGDTPAGQPEAPVAAEPEAEPLSEEPEGDTEEDEPHVVWAKKKYGDDPNKWAKAAHDQEQHISRMGNSLREAEQLAGQWAEYAQSLEGQAQMPQAGMPLSSSEENWIEQQALMNPMEAARHAAFSGNMNLYNGVIQRIAEENPMLAGQIGAQVQFDLQQAAQQQAMQQQAQQVHPEAELPIALAQSFARLGIDLEKNGPQMSEKIGELGEYHPYVQALINGDDAQRDLAVQAVYDLMRSSSVTKRVVRDEQRAEQIRREGELRREAASVVTGSPHVDAPKGDPFLDAMRQEWQDRRQYGEE